MNIYEYQRSRSFIDLGPNLSDWIFLNFFSSITTRPTEAKFHVEPPMNGPTKASANGPGRMTNMAAMPIYGKNLLKSSSLEPKGGWPWDLVCTIEYFKIYSNNAPGFTLTYFIARSNSVPYAFVLEKVKIMDFSETIVVYGIKVGRRSQLKWIHEVLLVPKVKVIHWPWSKSLRINIIKLLFLNYADFNISSAFRWAIQDQWASGYCNVLKNAAIYWLDHIHCIFEQFMGKKDIDDFNG